MTNTKDVNTKKGDSPISTNLDVQTYKRRGTQIEVQANKHEQADYPWLANFRQNKSIFILACCSSLLNFPEKEEQQASGKHSTTD